MKPLLIGGEWVTTSHALPNVNPSDVSDIVDVHAQAGRSEAEAAIAAASAAAPAWGRTDPQT
ncbi:MAG: aldehyde dehydrogenase family protein, partial [Aurantimonas coralicida]|nr:aldehyde dehydrogenase family protein [Aurantimonas coralicida]